MASKLSSISATAANIHDVARVAGVSPSTVSRSFRNPTTLSPATQRHVIEVAQKLNYRPRTEASAARKQDQSLHSSNVIGFQFFSLFAEAPDVNPFYAPMLVAAQSEAERLGLSVLLGTSSWSNAGEKLPRMIGNKLIGVLLLVGTPSAEVLSAFLESVPHVVLLDNKEPTGKSSTVRSDGFRGTYDATRYLFELGHRDIAFTYASDRSGLDDRFYGFVSAHLDAGRTVDDRLIWRAPQYRCDIVAFVSKRLEESPRPTAIFGVNDEYALDAVEACRRSGLRVPEDISVVGFDDTEASRRSTPALTTVAVKKEKMGRIAVRQLFNEMRSDEADDLHPVEIRVAVELQIRESCRALKPS